MSFMDALHGGFLSLAYWFILGWGFPCIGAAIGVASERSGRRISRMRYLLWLGLFGILPYLLLRHFLPDIRLAFLAPDLAEFSVPTPLQNTYAFLAATGLARMLMAFISARLLVRRLRDANLQANFAYLAAFPYVQLLAFLLPALYPPSRTNGKVTASVLLQM